MRNNFPRVSGFKERPVEGEDPPDAVRDDAEQQADALRSLADHRHQAAWAVRGIDTRATPLLRATRTHEASAPLHAPGAGQALLAEEPAEGSVRSAADSTNSPTPARLPMK